MNNLSILKWYIDGSHNVHWDWKGTWEQCPPLERELCQVTLKEDKTEHTKLDWADLYMPEMLWSLYFIKDRVDDGEVKIVHCPMEEMWVDVLTKPLQRKAFRVMHAKLMNCDVYEKKEVRLAATNRHPASQVQWPGEWPSEVPPRHCRSVLEDLRTGDRYGLLTDDLLECLGCKGDTRIIGDKKVQCNANEEKK